MLLSRAQLMLHKFCSTDETRPNLQGIQFRANGVAAATDGHRLGRLASEDIARSRDKKSGFTINYPYPKEWGPVPIPKEGIVLPAKQIAEVLKALPKKVTPGTHHSAADYALLEKIDGKIATVSVTDGASTRRFEMEIIDQPFPDYEQVIPKAEPAFQIGFNLRYVEDMLKAIAATLPNPAVPGITNQVTWSFNGQTGASTMIAKNDGEELLCLLMPLRITD